MNTTSTTSASFGTLHFGSCNLGDARRTRRLVSLADGLLDHPAGTLPHKFQRDADYRAFCRLMNQTPVTHAAVLQPHYAQTRQRLAQHPGVALLVHDTTELDYSGHTTLSHLGQIGNGHGHGFECHNSLAVDPASRRLLGLVNQILHSRRRVPPGDGRAARRAHPRRESRLWLRAVQAIGPAPAGARWVDICDRGADTFEFLEYQCTHGRSFVVRSTHNRALLVDGEGPPVYLHDYLRGREAVLGWEVAVSGQPGQPARTARVLASAAAVRVRAPHNRRGEHGRQPLELWAMRVWEVEAPPEVKEPVEWVLLTEREPGGAVGLRERVGWYECRPLVEEYHKAQKTGAGIEQLQFQSQAGLEPAIGVLSVVAVELVNLRVAAREERTAGQPARQLVDPLWVRVLSVWRYQEERELTVREFTVGLAELGGYLRRQRDALPGWLTLWRGWNALHNMVAYELARARSGTK